MCGAILTKRSTVSNVLIVWIVSFIVQHYSLGNTTVEGVKFLAQWISRFQRNHPNYFLVHKVALVAQLHRTESQYPHAPISNTYLDNHSA